MQSIKEKTIKELIVNKSRFIAVIYPVFDQDMVNNYLKQIRCDYLNANHYCFAYIIGDEGIIQKASDDKEPTRTAGLPILEVLKKHDLTNVLAIVIRYFGGIKLGTGGLIRAYSGATTEALTEVTYTKKTTTLTCTVECSYDCLGACERYLREHTNLIKVDYASNIVFTFKMVNEEFESVKESLFHKNNYKDTLKIQSTFSEYV